MKTFGRWVACILYIIVVAAVCGYVLFPDETAKRYITAQIKRVNPDVQVSIERIVPIFPPGLQLQECVLDYHARDLFRAEEVRVFPVLFSLFGELKKFSFQIAAHSGMIHGRTTISAPGPAGRFDMDADIKDVQLEVVPLLKEFLQHELQGRLSGRLHYSSDGTRGMILNARIDVDDLVVALNIPGFSLDRADFERVRAEIQVDKGRIEVPQLTLSGAVLEGRLSGDGVLNSNLWESTIELKGTLQPKFESTQPAAASVAGGAGSRSEAAAPTLPVTIYGPLNNLRFTMK